jgi:hypothetical protein
MGICIIQPPKRIQDPVYCLDNTEYYADKEGFVVAWNDAIGNSIIGYIGIVSPTTIVARDSSNGVGIEGSVTFPVPKTWRWKTVGAKDVWWYPLNP